MALRDVYDLTPRDAELLQLAASVGTASLAQELERHGFSSPESSGADAVELRSWITTTAQATRHFRSRQEAAAAELIHRRAARGEA